MVCLWIISVFPIICLYLHPKIPHVQGRSAIEMEKWDLPTLFRRQYAHFVIHKLLWFHCKFSLVIQDDSTFIIVNS